jgi:transposase
LEEKIGWVRWALELGMAVLLAAREAGVASSQIFQWKRLYLDCALSEAGANEPVVAPSELQDAHRQIKRLEQALGRKTLENEILREAVNFAKAKKWLACSPGLPEDGQ